LTELEKLFNLFAKLQSFRHIHRHYREKKKKRKKKREGKIIMCHSRAIARCFHVSSTLKSAPALCAQFNIESSAAFSHFPSFLFFLFDCFFGPETRPPGTTTLGAPRSETAAEKPTHAKRAKRKKKKKEEKNTSSTATHTTKGLT
jgi:hypothetical protein